MEDAKVKRENRKYLCSTVTVATWSLRLWSEQSDDTPAALCVLKLVALNIYYDIMHYQEEIWLIPTGYKQKASTYRYSSFVQFLFPLF